jgi:hypothetical protein
MHEVKCPKTRHNKLCPSKQNVPNVKLPKMGFITLLHSSFG